MATRARRRLIAALLCAATLWAPAAAADPPAPPPIECDAFTCGLLRATVKKREGQVKSKQLELDAADKRIARLLDDLGKAEAAAATPRVVVRERVPVWAWIVGGALAAGLVASATLLIEEKASSK